MLTRSVPVRPAGQAATDRWIAPAAQIGFLLAVGLLIWTCCLYLSHAAFLDHIESAVLISGWQYLNGMPLYGIEGGAPHFATYYGPLTYLAPLPAMLLFGPSVSAGKLLFVLAPLLTTAVMGWHFWRRKVVSAPAGLFYLVSGLLIFGRIIFWLRPDPLETLLVAIAVALAATQAAALGVGICLGLIVNLKIHAFLYILPILFDLWQRRGWRPPVVALASSLIVFLIPFLFPGISFADYHFGLAQQVGARAADLRLAKPWLTVSLVFACPLLAGLANARPTTTRGDRRYVLAAIAVLLLLAYPATFPGAGAYHLLPLVPVFADGFSRIPTRLPALLSVFIVITIGAVVAATVRDAATELGWQTIATEEAVAFAQAKPGKTVQVGYGETTTYYQVSQLARAVLALQGRPAQIDAQVLMELQYVGFDGSSRWTPLVSGCRVDNWIIPHNETPFALHSYYDQEPVFDGAFRAAFMASYRLERAGQHFDLWRCISQMPG